MHTKRFLVVSRVRIFQCCLRCSMYNTAKLKTMLLWMQSFLHPGEVVLCTCGLLHVKSFAQCHHTTRSVRSHRPTRSVPHHRGGGYLAQPCKGWSPNHQLPIWHWKFCSLSVFNPDRALYKSTPQTGGEKVSEHSVLAPPSACGNSLPNLYLCRLAGMRQYSR